MRAEMADMRTSNQLGQDDGHEREELRVIGSTLIAPCDLGSAGASGWSATLTAAEFQDKMVLLGDQAVLERRTGGELIIGLCNPAGGMVPYKPSGTPIDDCTLSYHAAIVESGVTDMQLLPEAHLTVDGFRTSKQYLAKMHPGVVAEVGCHLRVAPLNP